MLQNLTPITRNLVLMNVILFVIIHLFPNLLSHLAAYIPLSSNFRSWQIVTHMFMHGSFFHLLFNMLALTSFSSLERTIGEKNFVILYFSAGLGSFILYNFWNYYQVYKITQILVEQGVNIHEIYLQSIYSYTDMSSLDLPKNTDIEKVYALVSLLKTPMLGASGAIFGIMAAFATLYPNAELMIMFIPFPIKAKILFPIIIAGSLCLGIKQINGDNTAHFAHVGGALIGWIWMKVWKKNRNRIA